MSTEHPTRESDLVSCVDCLKQVPRTQALALNGDKYACCELHRDEYLADLPEEQFGKPYAQVA